MAIRSNNVDRNVSIYNIAYKNHKLVKTKSTIKFTQLSPKNRLGKQIRACLVLADQTQNAESIKTGLFAAAYKGCLALHQVADQSVSSTRTAHQIVLALISAAVIHVLVCAASMPSALHRITNPNAPASRDMKEIRMQDVTNDQVSAPLRLTVLEFV